MRERNHYCEKEKKTGAQCAGHEEPVWVGEAVDLRWSRVGWWSGEVSWKVATWGHEGGKEISYENIFWEKFEN